MTAVVPVMGGSVKEKGERDRKEEQQELGLQYELKEKLGVYVYFVM